MGDADSAFLYFESRWPDGTTAPFLVDDITVASQAPPVVEDLTPVKDTVDFPLGAAIDSRETTERRRSSCCGTSTRSRPRTT